MAKRIISAEPRAVDEANEWTVVITELDLETNETSGREEIMTQHNFQVLAGQIAAEAEQANQESVPIEKPVHIDNEDLDDEDEAT